MAAGGASLERYSEGLRILIRLTPRRRCQDRFVAGVEWAIAVGRGIAERRGHYIRIFKRMAYLLNDSWLLRLAITAGRLSPLCSEAGELAKSSTLNAKST